MTDLLKELSKIDPKRLAEIAGGEEEARRRDGTWSGGIRAHTEYQTRPLEWIVKYLGIPENTLRWSMNEGYEDHEWDGDVDPLVQILQGLADWKDVGVESATGTGKTYLGACIVYWFLACFENSIVVTAAPTEKMLLLQIWKEIGGLWPLFHRHFPEAEIFNGKIRMSPPEQQTGDAAPQEKWAATAFVCGVGASEELAGRAKGFHARDMLIITEETQAVYGAIISSFDHTRTDDHNLHLAFGNPDNQQDELHLFCERPSVLNLRIAAYDHPNVVTGKSIVPGAIGKRRLAEREVDFAPPTSRQYLSQLRGVSPLESEEALIRWEWCEAAAHRFEDDSYRDGPLSLGVDVADSPTGDKAAISRWQGATCTEVESFHVKDASEVGKRVFREATDTENPVDPRHIGIDSVGVGASAINELRRLGMKIRHISGGTKAIPGLDKELLWSVTEPDMEGNLKARGPKVVEAEEYDNLRSQVWWRMREDLRLGRVALCRDVQLFKDLTAPKVGTPNNRISVEPKDKIKARLRRSPDKGDACVYGNFVRPRTRQGRKLSDEELVEAGMVIGSANRDIGLERMAAKVKKRRAAEDRKIERRYGRKS
ncbi:MAG TPA: hypothetical protein VMX15_02900 [Candidatus Heimdallarchaeota archaeon]|nr:hypothetical protein [Candidatus Heimdallarchaeota archaeon]